MQEEKGKTHALFGVVALFFVGHLCRICLDFKEFYNTYIGYNDPFIDKDCNRTCASNFPLWSHVSNTFTLLYNNQKTIYL